MRQESKVLFFIFYSPLPSLLSALKIQSEGALQPAVRPAEPAAGRAAEPAAGAAAMPRMHLSSRTLAPSALTPQTPHDAPAVEPNPPRFPLSPKKPPAQRPRGPPRNKINHRETGDSPDRSSSERAASSVTPAL